METINLEKIYVSHLREVLVENAEGWRKFVPVDKSFQPTGSELIDRIAAFLANDFRCQAKEVARELGISERKLNILFRNLYDANLYDFLRNYRTRIQLEMLKYSGLKVTEIAERCGCCYRQLERCVEKATGMSPLKYRLKKRPADYKERFRW